MNTIERLTEIFKHFPGIGPRQAKRFVYFLLTRDEKYIDDLLSLVTLLKKEIVLCADCQRFFVKNGKKICQICADGKRDMTMLMVVGRDVDLEAIEKSGTYDGYYFVIGGNIPILETAPEKRVRLEGLTRRVSSAMKNGLREIIIAGSVTPEGEHTVEVISQKLRSITAGANVKISTLGRGLSTGTELEYSDTETIKNALKNRG